MSDSRKVEDRRAGWWTHDAKAFMDIGEHLYYFAPANAAPPPYTTQRHVEAIIDIAQDGTLAGVELIENMPPPPATPPSPVGVDADALDAVLRDLEPELFSDDFDTRHRAASPFDIDHCQREKRGEFEEIIESYLHALASAPQSVPAGTRDEETIEAADVERVAKALYEYDATDCVERPWESLPDQGYLKGAAAAAIRAYLQAKSNPAGRDEETIEAAIEKDREQLAALLVGFASDGPLMRDLKRHFHRVNQGMENRLDDAAARVDRALKSTPSLQGGVLEQAKTALADAIYLYDHPAKSEDEARCISAMKAAGRAIDKALASPEGRGRE